MNHDRTGAFLVAAESARGVLSHPATAAGWSNPSALAEFTVAALAGHLAQQVTNVEVALGTAVPDDFPLVSLTEHYARSVWLGTGVDDAANVAIRDGGQRAAAGGVEQLTGQVADAISRLRTDLAAQRPDQIVRMPWWDWSMTLDDLLLTRIMEISVHSDDLCVSVGVTTPALPAEVIEPVLDLLVRVSAKRHGHIALLRALSRAERAPATVSAF